ncbi:MAG: dTMP kinase [Nitrospira sp.]|nr:dTMP kinase [Nitrospira sp.]
MSPATQKPSGIFITLEGGEGSGKTTQARRLCDWLTTQGWQVLHTREPGGTLLAERVRGLLLDHSAEAIAPETEAWLILAARRQHVDHVIKPALQQGMIVVCDRFSDSTIAYQGYGRGLDLRVLRTMNKWATGKLVPHLTLLFDVPVRVGLRRRRSQRASQNRIDREATQFHEKVRAGFRTLARQEPRRMVVFDASLPLESVQQHVVTFITRWFKRRGIQQPQQR